MLGLGGENRLTAPYITYYGVYEQKEECLDYSVKFGIQAPYNESYSLHVDPSYTLIPCMRRNDFLNPVTLGVRKSSNKIKIEEMEEYYRLTMSEMPAFTPNYFQAQKQFPLEKKKQLYASAASRDGKIIGEIWNNTDFSFENVVMVVGNEIVRVGEIPAGGMSTPEAGITYSFTSGGLPLLLNTKLNPQEAEEWEEIAEIYKNIISQNIQNSKMDGYILGVVTGGELDLQMKSGYETYGNNFYLAPVEVSSYPKYRWGE